MKFLKSRKLVNMATMATATFATLGFVATNPAAAAIFNITFCGFFEGDTESNPVGQVLPGSYITIDTNKTENFGLVDAKITTARPVAGQNELTYNFSDFTVSGQGTSIPNLLSSDGVFDGSGSLIDSVYWRFVDTVGNNFNAVIPASIYNNLSGNIGTIELADSSEIRINGSGSKECDARTNYCRGQNPPPTRPGMARVVPVPEPTSLFGTAIALGFGAMLTKKNLSKLNKKKVLA